MLDVILCLSACIFAASFMHLYISIGASYLGMLDVQHVDVKDVLLEPNPKMMFG